MLTACVVVLNDWDNPYKRPISGDAKGYYAYLPAVIIYQDLEFKFVDEIEQKYYPKDGSLKKDFLIEQPNGTFVNKCFPGVSIFYLPFFLFAYLFSYFVGYPIDGYSQLFQMSLIVSHLFYYMLSLFLMNKILIRNQVGLFNRFLTLFLLTFGTNIFFYTTLDFSVVHVFGFFGK